jgi:hypothetical protein
MLETCEITVRSSERFAQTGVGWLLRELATADREAVLGFVNEHLASMSREGVRYVIERMPVRVREQVLKKHARPRGARSQGPFRSEATRIGRFGRFHLQRRVLDVESVMQNLADIAEESRLT